MRCAYRPPPPRRPPPNLRSRLAACVRWCSRARSAPALSAGCVSLQAVVDRNPLMGFGKVTVRVAMALAVVFVLVTIFPSLLFATALVPANTLMAHVFIWNVLTAPFVETSFIGVAVACGVTLLVGKQLEPLWGSKEMLRFILVVTLSTSAATFLTCIFLYASSQQLHFIYDPIHGYSGLTGAYLVAVKQLLPEQQTKLCGVFKAKAKDLAGLYVVAYLMFFMLFNGHFGEFLFVSYGVFRTTPLSVVSQFLIQNTDKSPWSRHLFRLVLPAILPASGRRRCG